MRMRRANAGWTRGSSPLQIPIITPTPPPWTFPWRISFQPSSSEVPDGYAVDDGSAFALHNDHEYGWQ